MNILIIGLNYAPEMVGIGPFTAGTAEHFAATGHSVTVICAQPYYPEWKVHNGYDGKRKTVTHENGVNVIRLPIYVPAVPNGRRRIRHHWSFTRRALREALAQVRLMKPDLVLAVAPSIMSVIAARAAVRATGAKLWIHIQDFEVEAAFATGLVDERGPISELAQKFEKWAIQADFVSSISPQMCKRLVSKGISTSKIFEFRNWTDTEKIAPLGRDSTYRTKWGISKSNVALYSGNISNKQGLEIVIASAKKLEHRTDLLFLICGNGPSRDKLVASASGLTNVRFEDLQASEDLSELLGLATIHLLPQIAGAADLVLPSKMANMLASGKPIVATAELGTGIAEEVIGCGYIVPPSDVDAFVSAIYDLINNASIVETFSNTARERAIQRWSKEYIFKKLDADLGKFLAAL